MVGLLTEPHGRMASKKTSHNGARSNGSKASSRGGRSVDSVRPRKTSAQSATRAPARRSSARKPSERAPRRESLRRSYLVPLAFAVLLIVGAWSYYPVARMNYQEQREKERLQVELESVRERNASLREQVERLKTPEGVEEIARESLGLVKEGENLYVVLDGTDTPTVAAVTPGNTDTVQGDSGLWRRALDAVFGFEE